MSRPTRWTSYGSTVDSEPAPRTVYAEGPRADLAESRGFEAEETPSASVARAPHDVLGAAPLGGRTTVLLTLVAIFFLVVIIRLVHWQLGGAAAPADTTAGPPADTSRGRIVDRDGLLLVTDGFAWEVYANPIAIQKAKLGPTLAVSLTQILSTDGAPAPAGAAVSVETIRASLATTLSMVTLAKGVPESQVAALEALSEQIENPFLVWADDRRIRIYPQGSLAAHVLGFTNYEQRGVYGVEANYDAWLRTDGQWPSQLPTGGAPSEGWPSGGTALPDAWKLYLPSPGGHDLVLHLDAPLQQVAERRLAEAVARYEAQGGCIIAMDPRTGGILALANYPTFDPNRYSDVPPRTWINAAVADLYEPGSVFKIVTFAGALDSGQITPDTRFYDSGSLLVGNRYIRNSELRAIGDVTATEALARSLNVVSARIALDMGSDTFYRYLRQFGFGRLTEVDLDAESYGIVKEPEDKYWSLFDQATNSFGQALSATSLQMLNATAAIANNGTRLQPQIVKGMIQDGRLYPLAPRVLGDAVKPEAARTLTRMMVYTVDKSLYPKLVPGYRVAGKTGTAEIATETGYTSPETITSFVGFLPAADPQVVILVKLDKPKHLRWAEQVAMPTFGQFAQDAVRILRIQPDDRGL